MNQQPDIAELESDSPSPKQRRTLYPAWVWWILIAQVGIGIVNVGLGFLIWDKGIYWIWALNPILADYVVFVYQLLGVLLLLSVPFLILRAIFQDQTKEKKQRTTITVLLSLGLLVISLPVFAFNVFIYWSGPFEHNNSVHVSGRTYRLAHHRNGFEADENEFMLYECGVHGLVCQQVLTEWNTWVSASDVRLIYVPTTEELRAVYEDTVIMSYELSG